MRQTLLALILAGFLASCASVSHEPLVVIDPAGFRPTYASVREQYESLQALIQGRPGAKETVEDILAAMEAVQFEEQGIWEEASKKWLFVLANDSAGMASIAFPRWVKTQERLVAEPVQAEILARLLWAQTMGGQKAPWLKKQGLIDVQRLTLKIRELQGGGPVQGRPALPNSPRDIKDDPFLEKAAKASCRRELPELWLNWYRTLSRDVRLYWDGLQASCRAQHRDAIVKYQQALPGLRLSISTWPYAINAAEKIVSARKSLGQREETTAAYGQLAELLNQSETGKAHLGWSDIALWRKRIDTWFWVARSQALQGDYQSAKIAVHEGFNQLKQAEALQTDLKEQQGQIFSDLKAEGYNILASRIAYEEKDLAAALALTRMGQDIPRISAEWRLRLDWSEAWFAYRMEDRARAIRVWSTILLALKDEQQRPRLYYWIGRACHEEARYADSDSYFKKLQSEYPLSFYTIVGLPRIDKKYNAHERFTAVPRLEQRLRTSHDIPWAAYQADSEANTRVIRLELMLAAKASIWLELIANELFRHVNSRTSLLNETEGSIYVTRLLHMSGAYLPAIALTSQLASQVKGFWENYPEQMLIYFPQPYQDIYQRAAGQNYIDQEIPLAISRQESSFQVDAVSPAEAIGLMQLMSNTALRQASRLGLPLREPEVDLKRPELNITLGTAYLAELGRRYRGQWHQAFAAYNAGEYAVDAWLLRRRADDPLVWIEALSFAETSVYAKNVWRNWEVYRWLRGMTVAKPLL